MVVARDGRTASSMLRSLAPYLYALVATHDGRSMARAVLALPGANAEDRGRVLYYDAAVSMDMGLADETRVALAEAAALFTSIDDLHGLSMVENLRCFHEATLGNYVEACVAGEGACELARKAGSEELDEIAKGHLAYAYLGLGTAGPLRDEAALRRCLALLESAVDRAEASGSPYDLRTAHGNIANPLIELGELDAAARHVTRAVELHREFGFQLPYVLFTAAVLASRLGQHATAIRLLVPCLDDLDRKGVPLQAYDAPRLDALWADARASLGHENLEAATRSARAMSIGQALELALTLGPKPSARRRDVSG
jgi:tetratricopeptide (TPR) repeat protein